MFTVNEKGFLNMLQSENVSSSDFKKMFNQKTWSRTEVFMKASHNTVDDKYKIPCNTIGGNEMGAPCSFPFVYPDCLGNFTPIS